MTNHNIPIGIDEKKIGPIIAINTAIIFLIKKPLTIYCINFFCQPNIPTITALKFFNKNLNILRKRLKTFSIRDPLKLINKY